MWFFVFVLLLNTGAPVSACTIQLTPPRVVVKYGDPLFANCTSQLCSNVEGLGWESPYNGIGLRKDVTSLALNIPKLEAWEISPFCFITFTTGQDQTIQTLPVTVYQIPTKVSLSQYSAEANPLVEGARYTMQCDVEGVVPDRHLVVLWHKGNTILHTDIFIKSSLTPVNKTTKLNLKAHRADDGSEIWCEAKLNLWTEEERPLPSVRSESFKLTVHYTPVFTTPENQTLEVLANAKITLNCTASGNPRPDYSWTFANPTQKALQDQVANGPLLTPDVLFSGTYSCTASNKFGKRTKYFTVIEKKGNRTTFAAILGGFGCLAVVLLAAGLFVTPNGTFSVNKGYLNGRLSSGPI